MKKTIEWLTVAEKVFPVECGAHSIMMFDGKLTLLLKLEGGFQPVFFEDENDFNDSDIERSLMNIKEYLVDDEKKCDGECKGDGSCGCHDDGKEVKSDGCKGCGGGCKH